VFAGDSVDDLAGLAMSHSYLFGVATYPRRSKISQWSLPGQQGWRGLHLGSHERRFDLVRKDGDMTVLDAGTSQETLERASSTLSDSVAHAIGTAGEALADKLGPALDSAASRGRQARKRTQAKVAKQTRRRRRQLETATQQRSKQLTKAAKRAKNQVQDAGLEVAGAVADRGALVMAASRGDAVRTSSHRARTALGLLAVVAVGAAGVVAVKRSKAAPTPPATYDENRAEVTASKG
jgi:hypothetical protein